MKIIATAKIIATNVSCLPDRMSPLLWSGMPGNHLRSPAARQHARSVSSHGPVSLATIVTRRSTVRSRIFHVLSETFWVLALCLIGLFAFFVLLGALSPTSVAGLSIAVLVLAVLWVVHARWEAHRRVGRDVAATRARERRGF
jgi:ABC-type xylose transport system permease subunit